jgi:acyl carrier protein
VPIENVKIYILDNYLKPVPTNVIGEIYIGGAALARGYLNNPELAAQKFVISHLSLVISSSKKHSKAANDRLYQTGDLAKPLPDGNIEFLGRRDQQVKIRGYRIELGEIENRLLNNSQVKEAVVVAREEADGDRYLCAYIVPAFPGPASTRGSTGAFESSGLRKFLSEELPAYMVPSYIAALDEIPLTPNGKVDRKALPGPVPEAAADYAAPGNALEEKLVEIWLDVLGLSRDAWHDSQGNHLIIGINDNFFELGGHSLKATILVSKIHKELNVKVPLAEVFKHQTIRGLSKYIGDMGEDKYASIEPVEKKEYFALSSAQKRLYFLQQTDLNSTGYNMPFTFPLGENIEKNKLESTLKQLIARHENLRTSFTVVDGEPTQRVHDEVEFKLEYFNHETHEKHERGDQSKVFGGPGTFFQKGSWPPEAIIKNFIRPFDLTRAPLMRSGLIKLPEGLHIWMVDMHHIISDGTSHMILSEDFLAFYNGTELEPLRLHYKDFSQWQNRSVESCGIKDQESYWLELFSGEIPRLELPADNKRPEVFTFAGDVYSFRLDREDALKFKALGSRNGATLYMNILAVVNTLFYKYSGQKDIIIGTGIAGRPHADLQHIIGMFVNTLGIYSLKNW